MDNGLMSIGKAAEMSHLSVATLRLYDELGLLKPKYKDPETGYRYYDIAQNARLDMIVYMKELGMSLTEIGDVLEKEDIVLIETILTQKNEQLHRQMRELRAQHDAVERAIASIERYRKSPETGTVVLEYIDRRYIWGVPCACNFYEEGLRAFEQELVVLRKALIERGFLQAHSYNVGTSIKKRISSTETLFLRIRLFLSVIGISRLCREPSLSTAVCMPASIWTALTMRLNMQSCCCGTARRITAPSAGTIFAK